MRSKIDQELLRLGAPTGRLGYVQMAMTLELIMQEEQVTSTTRVLYPKVAERCNTKPARIERNVREEIKAIWKACQHKSKALLNALRNMRHTMPTPASGL